MDSRQPPSADDRKSERVGVQRAGTASNRLPFRLIALGLLALIAAAAVFAYDHAAELDARIGQFDASRGAVERGRALLATAREIEWRRGILGARTPRDDLQVYKQTLDDLQPQIDDMRQLPDPDRQIAPLLTQISAILAEQQAGIGRLLGDDAAADGSGADTALPLAPVSHLQDLAERLLRVLDIANDGQRIAVTSMVREGTVATYVTLALLATLSILAMVLGSRHFDALRMHEDLRVQVRETRRESDEKSSFLALVSHEIRTPMNAVFGFAGLLRDRLRDPADRRYVDAITTGARALLTLINDLLDLSRIEAGHLALHRAPVHLRDLLDSIVALFARQAQDKNLLLVLKTPDAMPILMLDADRVRQMLINLVSNALKHTEHGSIRLSVELQARGEQNRFDLQLRVADTGRGIAREEIEQIFEPFVQGRHDAAGRRSGGTGLGLSITRQLAQMMGGDVGVSSEPGRGSCFTIALPAVAVAARGDIAAQASLPADIARTPSAAADEPAPDDTSGQYFPGRLLDELLHLQREVWPALNDTLTMSEVRSFAAKIERLAVQGEQAALAAYARQLGRSATDFDVAVVETLLADYPARVSALRRDVSPTVRGDLAHAR
jgi:signal transduction histidine kinase